MNYCECPSCGVRFDLDEADFFDNPLDDEPMHREFYYIVRVELSTLHMQAIDEVYGFHAAEHLRSLYAGARQLPGEMVRISCFDPDEVGGTWSNDLAPRGCCE